MDKKFCLIGCGRAGLSISSVLIEKGWKCCGLASRRKISALSAQKLIDAPILKITEIPKNADVIIIAVNDSSITDVAKKLAGAKAALDKKTFIHLSGALPASALSPLEKMDAAILSMHPLTVISDVPSGKENITSGIVFAYEGNKRAYKTAEKITRDLHGIPFRIRAADKPLYHSIAVLCSNNLIAILNEGIEVFQSFGLDNLDAKKGLINLMYSSIKSAKNHSIIDALTGPVDRGDIETIERHCNALNKNKDLLDLYIALQKLTLSMVIKKYPIRTKINEALAKALKKWQNYS